jgi:arsenite-transporting ATPase
LQLSRLGYRTLVMSVDPAHSLADSFDLEANLFHGRTGDPQQIDEHLAIHESIIQKEIKRHWREISSYVTSVLRLEATGQATGNQDVFGLSAKIVRTISVSPRLSGDIC